MQLNSGCYDTEPCGRITQGPVSADDQEQFDPGSGERCHRARSVYRARRTCHRRSIHSRRTRACRSACSCAHCSPMLIRESARPTRAHPGKGHRERWRRSHHAGHETRSAHGIGPHRASNSRNHEPRMPRCECRQGEDRPLLHARTGAARVGEALHIRTVGPGEARWPAHSGDRIDDKTDHEPTDSAGKCCADSAAEYLRWYARHVIAQRSGSSRSSWCV